MANESPESRKKPPYDGSTAHPDGRREKFCQEAVALNDVNRAYEAAGFARPRGNAYRMSREPKVALRLAYLWRKGAEHAELLGGRHLVKANLIAHANMFDFWDINAETGDLQRLNLAKVPHALGGAIQEISYDSEGRPKLKLYPADAMLRFLIERTDPSVRKLALTDPTGREGVQPVIVEIVSFADVAEPVADQAAA